MVTVAVSRVYVVTLKSRQVTDRRKGYFVPLAAKLRNGRRSRSEWRSASTTPRSLVLAAAGPVYDLDDPPSTSVRALDYPQLTQPHHHGPVDGDPLAQQQDTGLHHRNRADEEGDTRRHHQKSFSSHARTMDVTRRSLNSLQRYCRLACDGCSPLN